MASEATVFVVDDDDAVRDSLRALLESAGFLVRDFRSAREFLADTALPNSGCLIADIRMPDMDGLALQQELVNRAIDIPVIMITGHGDVPIAVRAMKAGAVDFIEKPFDADVLIESLRRGLGLADEVRGKATMGKAAEQRIAMLSERERQVLERLVTGRPNKIIAFRIGHLAPHRRGLSRPGDEEMKARSLSDLVRQALALGISPSFKE
jgi:two-component system response regulator FixJ